MGIRERLWRLATVGGGGNCDQRPPKKTRSLSRMASALSREFLWRKRGSTERNVYTCNAATNTNTDAAAFPKRVDGENKDASRSRGSSCATPVQKPQRAARTRKA